jgi:hypothetical protein
MNQQVSEFQIVEAKDEDQILAEMRGEVLASYVYSFQQAGRTVTALSYAGVKEIVRRRGNVHVNPCPHCLQFAHTEEKEKEIHAQVLVWDLKNNVQFLGASSALKSQPFAYTLAINKAERNALRKLMPEKMISVFIVEWLKRDKSPWGSEPKSMPVGAQTAPSPGRLG